MLPPGCVVVVGLLSEAVLLPKGSHVLVSGGSTAHLEAMLNELSSDVAAVLSFGIAGGLTPTLSSGTLMAAQWVDTGTRRLDADRAWLDILLHRTSAAPAGIAASDRILANAAEKALLHTRTGAAAVDMESGVAAMFAAQRGLPFAALRCIADEAGDTVPAAAACGVNPDGSVAPHRVIAALIKNPRDLPGLIRIARASAKAHAALSRAMC